MRKSLKFFHTVSAAGIVGVLVAYMAILMLAPPQDARSYADLRTIISALCSYVLLPSLAIALFTGLIAMAVHKPFQDKGWVWIKALMGLAMFEATLAIVQSKAVTAAALAARIASGEAEHGALATAISTEWGSLAAITALSVANVLLGVWRPRIAKWS